LTLGTHFIASDEEEEEEEEEACQVSKSLVCVR
jgi:hypothetical protein